MTVISLAMHTPEPHAQDGICRSAELVKLQRERGRVVVPVGLLPDHLCGAIMRQAQRRHDGRVSQTSQDVPRSDESDECQLLKSSLGLGLARRARHLEPVAALHRCHGWVSV